MTGLQADNFNQEFFRNFMTETIYVVEGDTPAPAPAPELPAATSVPVQEAEMPKPEIKPEPAVKNQITDHKPVDTPHIPKMPAAAVATEKYKIAGANAKGVVVLVTVPDDEFERLPQLQFLQKILSAIGLLPTDVAYVNNKSGATAQFEDLQQALQVNYIISFASRLDTKLPHDKFTLYHPVIVRDVPVVFSQSLSMLEHDVEHKKMLWGALQQVFL